MLFFLYIYIYIYVQMSKYYVLYQIAERLAKNFANGVANGCCEWLLRMARGHITKASAERQRVNARAPLTVEG